MSSVAASARQRWDTSFVSVVRNCCGLKLLLMSGVTEMGTRWTEVAFASKELLWFGSSQFSLAEAEQGCVEAVEGTDGEPALGGP